MNKTVPFGKLMICNQLVNEVIKKEWRKQCKTLPACSTFSFISDYYLVKRSFGFVEKMLASQDMPLHDPVKTAVLILTKSKSLS